MKIKKSELLNIINEETNNILNENPESGFTGKVAKPQYDYKFYIEQVDGTFKKVTNALKATHVVAISKEDAPGGGKRMSEKVKIEYSRYDQNDALMYAKNLAQLSAEGANQQPRDRETRVVPNPSRKVLNPKFGYYENKNKATNIIFERYFQKNSHIIPTRQRDNSIIEVIADEVNQALNNLPEIQLASEVLSEDELKNLFSPFAKQVVTKVSGQIEDEIRKMVEVNIDGEVAAKLLARQEITDEERNDILNQIRTEQPELISIDRQALQAVAEQEDNND